MRNRLHIIVKFIDKGNSVGNRHLLCFLESESVQLLHHSTDTVAMRDYQNIPPYANIVHYVTLEEGHDSIDRIGQSL